MQTAAFVILFHLFILVFAVISRLKALETTAAVRSSQRPPPCCPGCPAAPMYLTTPGRELTPTWQLGRKMWNIWSLSGSGCVVCSTYCSSRWHIGPQSVCTVVAAVTLVTGSVAVCHPSPSRSFQGQMWTHSDEFSKIWVEISSVIAAFVAPGVLSAHGE